MAREERPYRWRPSQNYQQWVVVENCLIPLGDALQDRVEKWCRPPRDEEDDSRDDFHQLQEQRFHEVFEAPLENELRRYDFDRAILWLKANGREQLARELRKKAEWLLRDFEELKNLSRQQLDGLITKLANFAQFLQRLAHELSSAREAPPSAAGDSQTKAESDVSTGEVESETPEVPPVKRPPENAMKAWRLRDLLGIDDQTKLAQKMTDQGVSATQGQVSRWLSQVEKYLEAGNILPDLKPMRRKPDSVDPAVVEMGQRQDNRTPRQRPRRDPNSNE